MRLSMIKFFQRKLVFKGESINNLSDINESFGLSWIVFIFVLRKSIILYFIAFSNTGTSYLVIRVTQIL